jgi:tetratricopeptide (TPR) repeat protein
MFFEDYLVRMINQALAVLMTAIGLRKAGKYSEALQAVNQAIEQLTTLPSNLIDQMQDAGILSMLSAQGELDIGRLAILADLYQEQGEILSGLDKMDGAFFAYERALRFTLEVVLAEDNNLSPENIGRIETLCQKVKERNLPVDTQLALSDYYQRLLDKDATVLAAGGVSRKHVGEALAKVQDQLAHL